MQLFVISHVIVCNAPKYFIEPYEFALFANLENDRFTYFLRKINGIPCENLAQTMDLVQNEHWNGLKTL